MKIKRIYIGGWFQWTTLHLTEVWDFLKHGKTHLGFSTSHIEKLRGQLALGEVRRESGPLEYIVVTTELGVGFRVYEDGLIVLEKPYGELQQDFKEIRDYYEHKLSKALSHLFSKGSPVPKELAHVETILPYIVVTSDATKEEAEQLFKECNEEIYSAISTQNIEVYRSPGVILINNLEDEAVERDIIESQIFFREFKSQLHRYLAIHRTVWERIRDIQERKTIRGVQVDEIRSELGSYEKTMDLIEAHIHQMPAYVKTRQKITDAEKIDAYLRPLFQFKFETLLDTHEYVEHLWDMTQNYLASALEFCAELQAKSTKNTISSLQLITTIGVVAGILGYLGESSLPAFTWIGAVYFALLLAMTWVLNGIVSRVYKYKNYSMEVTKDSTKKI